MSSEELHNAEIKSLQERINCLQCQNEAKFAMFERNDRNRGALKKRSNRKEEKIERVEKENKELLKEIKAKKKFVFKS